MNIALISREYPPFFGGGIGSYTERFAGALAGAGHRPVVVTVSADGREGRESRGGVTVVRLPFIAGDDWSGPHPAIATPEAVAAFGTFSPVSVLAMQVARAMPGLVREFAIEAIEAPDTGALGWFLLNARRTAAEGYRDLPPVTTVIHSPTEWIAHWNRAPLRGRAELELAWMERDQARWSDALVCPTAALADWASDHWSIPRDQIAVIPHALGDLEAMARSRADSPGSGGTGAGDLRTILFTGRLEPRKGVDTLIEAFARVRDARTELHLVGQDMPDPGSGVPFGRAWVERLAPPDLRQRIVLRGKVNPAELPALLAGAAVVAVPAPMDNFPLTCVEAMAQGKVVVGGNAGGVAEMIEDGVSGLLFAPGDAGGCARSLERALAMSAEEAHRMGSGAARRILALGANDRIVALRVAHFAQAGRTRASPGRADAGGAVMVNSRHVPGESLERLKAAVRDGEGVDFAHGWTCHDGRTRAFSTPTLESLALAPRQIGPLALSARAAADPSIAPFLLRRPPGGEVSCDSPWALAALLAAAGYAGAVAPEVLTETAPSALEEPELASLERAADDLRGRVSLQREEIDALREELREIKSSRGWAVLQRVYDLLHLLRGRGLRRPADYHRPDDTGPAPGPRGRNQIA